jgi:DNA-binding transcriptional regulator LsrR (DeoR family)
LIQSFHPQAHLAFTAYSLDAPLSDRLGISQMHVSRLLERALAYLRAQITKPMEMT